MKVLQLMSAPVDKIEKFINDGHSYHGHNLYGYISLKKDFNIDWYPQLNKSPKFVRGGINKRRLIAQLQCILNCKNYDIIYSPHDIHLLPIAILKYLQIIKTLVLMICHFSYNMNYVEGWYKKLLKRIERYFVFQSIDQVLFANKEMLDLALRDYNVPLKHQKVANWGANLKFFDEYIIQVRRSPLESYYAAMGWANRDYTTLCEAFRGTQLQLKILAGKRNIENRPSNVDLVDLSGKGMEGMAFLREYYYDAIAICLPITTTNDVPNGATVLVEALAMGKPIIATASETNYVDIEKEGIGICVKRNDVNGWKEAIKYLADNPDIRKTMGEKAKLLAKERLNLEIFTENVRRNLETLS